MYFAVGWPKYYGAKKKVQGGQPIAFKFNRDRSILAVLSRDTLSLWYCRPFVVIVSCHRPEESLIKLGNNEDFAWKFDSSSIVVKTSNGSLVFYELQLSKGDSGQLFVLNNQRNIGDSNQKITFGVPAILLAENNVVSIPGGVSCLSTKRNEIFVASELGVLHRLHWNGSVDQSLSLSIDSIPFSLDMLTSIASAQYLKREDSVIHDMQYSPLLGGFAFVLKNGRGGFLSASNAKFEPQGVSAIWARDLNQATRVKVNNKFRIIVYGCSHGSCMAYSFDEVTEALQFSHKIELEAKHIPICKYSNNLVDGVDDLCFSPDGHVLAVSWVGGGLAIWSVFGLLLFCTLDTTFHGLPEDVFPTKPWHISAMEWSVEGYNLILGIEKPASSSWIGTEEIIHVAFVKSVLTTNPCVANHHHLVLQGETCLYLSTADIISDTRTRLQDDSFACETPVPDNSACTSSSTKHWKIIQYPQLYIEKNWPIRYVAVDVTGMYFAIAGQKGVAYYSLLNRRWKLFGNESQEQGIYCRGGLVWWNEYLAVSCYNMHSNSDEVRFYPRSSNLDNAFATHITLTCSPFLVNNIGDLLLVYCSDCKLTFYSLERQAGETAGLRVSRLQEVSLVSHVPHPFSVIEITLSLTSFEEGCTLSNLDEVESLLLNTAGKLLMLEKTNEKQSKKKIQLSAPVVLASCVEGIWSSLKYKSSDKQHLVEALWLNCGSSGMKVWLPLFPGDDEKPPNFLSKRIMLPIKMSLCPLVVLCEEALVVGAASEPVPLDISSNQAISPEEPFSLYALERPAQVYLHHLLRQLLRRNLGIHALRIARGCSGLQYFPHVLELMLHEILEEEATASEPLPDAMLSRIVAFIQEFPEYLQTVVHCARKTEVALWSYFFAAVGNPRNLFQQCLDDGLLETAASYLIILQNLETPEVSKQLATILLEATLQCNKYEIARDLVRFLGSIATSDYDSPPPSPFTRTPVMKTLSSITDDEDDLTPLPQDIPSQFNSGVLKMTPRKSITRKNSSEAFQARSRQGSDDKMLNSPNLPSPTGNSQKPNVNSDGSQQSAFRYSQADAPESFFLETILNRHARKLLSSNRLKDLGRFSACLDFELRNWLQKERSRAAIINDFLEAFLSIHRQFDWPFPPRSPISQLNTALLSPNCRTSSLLPKRSSLPGAEENFQETRKDIHQAGFPPAARSNVELRGNSLAQSETSSVSFSLDDDPEGLEDSMWSCDTNIKDLDDFVGQIGGTKQADKEIRYLLQMMSEAFCFDWSLLLAIVLRDVPLVSQVIAETILSGLDELALENFIRIRDGIKTLENWAQHECQGYSAFFALFKSQWQSLSEAITTVATRLAETQHENVVKRENEVQESVEELVVASEDVNSDKSIVTDGKDQYECILS